MYATLLFVHSILRWVVLADGVAAAAMAWQGVATGRPWTRVHRILALLFLIGMDLQLLVGLALYGHLSPSTRLAMADFGAAMKDKTLRFWAVEHPAMMLLAVILVHVGFRLARSAPSDAVRHKRVAVLFTIALVLVLAAVPWPFRAVGRPWLAMP